MRQLEPFSYFAGQASAVAGFGGDEAPPDPRYFFHTRYEAVRPGRAVYRLTIEGARASRGELTLRIHAFKPGAAGEISLAGGGRLLFDDLRPNRTTVTLPVRFSAAPETHYALYGFFSDPTDLVAETIGIAIEELGTPADRGGAAAEAEKTSTAVLGFGDTAKLCTMRAPSILHPVSQPCTAEQLRPDLFDGLWPEIPPLREGPAARWAMVLPLQALGGAGMLAPDNAALVLNAPHPALAEVLRAAGCTVSDAADAGTSQQFDFTIGYDQGLGSDHAALPEILVGQTRRGGLAVAMLAFAPGETPATFRNTIQQIALRLIGRGHDVAQLCFPRQSTKSDMEYRAGGFGLVVRA